MSDTTIGIQKQAPRAIGVERTLLVCLSGFACLIGCASASSDTGTQPPFNPGGGVGGGMATQTAGTGGAGTGGSAGAAGYGITGSSSASGGTAGGGTAGIGGAATVGGAGGVSALGTGGAAGSGGSTTAGGSAGKGGSTGSGGSAGTGAGGSPGVGLAKGIQTARPIGTLYPDVGFWEYLPKGYGDGTKRPLLVFEPGVGENGDGTANSLNIVRDRHGPPNLISQGDTKWPPTLPFVVLSPQHHDLGGNPEPIPSEIYQFIAFALGHYDVDPTRVYLTGLSSGGTGSWIYLSAYPGVQVAAAALMSSDSTYAWDRSPDPANPCALVNKVWVWDFHGESDTTIPIASDLVGINHYKACPNPSKPVAFTSYPNTDHGGTWDKTYDLTLKAGPTPDIYTWLLSKHL